MTTPTPPPTPYPNPVPPPPPTPVPVPPPYTPDMDISDRWDPRDTDFIPYNADPYVNYWG